MQSIRDILIGREAALVQLTDALARARAGHGGLALITGEAGIGKTRLAESLAEQAQATILWGRAWEAGGAPAYWPLTEVIRALLRTEGGRARLSPSRRTTLAHLLPELAQDAPTGRLELPAREARFALMDALVGTLCESSTDSPLLVILEDMHAADVDSLLALELLAAQARTSRLLAVVTARPVPLDEAGPGSIFARLERLAQCVRLGRLSREQVQVFLEQAFGRAPAPEAVDSLHRSSEGNPLFLVEFARLWSSRGASAVSPAFSPRALPQSVRSVIAQRLGILSAPARELLELACVLGRELDEALLEELLADAAFDLQAALDEALNGAVLEYIPPHTLRFTHVLLRDVLYASLAPARREMLHRRVAEALIRRADQAQPAWAPLAHHLLVAGAEFGERAVEAARSAAEDAERRLAFDESASWLERALHAERAARPGASLRRAELSLLLARARNMVGDASAARRACHEAAELARSLHDPVLLARTALEYGRIFVFASVDPVLVSLLEEAQAALPRGELGLRARLMARHAAARQPAIDPQPPIEEAREALRLARKVSDPFVLLDALRSATSAMADLGEVRERLALNEELFALAQAHAQPFDALRALARLCFDYLELGAVGEAERVHAEVQQLANQLNLPHVLWFARGLSSMQALREGRFDESLLLAEEARALGERAGDPNVLRALSMQALARLHMRGHVDEALAHFPQARKTLAELDRGHGWLHVIEQALRAARGEPGPKLRADALEMSLSLADPSSMLFAAEFAYYTGDAALAERVEACLRRRSGLFVSWGALGLCMDGPVDYWLGLLLETRGQSDAAIRSHERALHQAEQAGARPYQAVCAHALARALSERGHGEDASRAQRLFHEAQARADQLGMRLLVRALGSGEREGSAVRALAGGEHASASAQPLSVAPPSGSRAQPAPPLDLRAATLALRGDYWELRAGETQILLEDSKGVRYLAQLMQVPGRSLHVLELCGASLTDTDRSDLGPALDERAVKQYKRRAQELREQLEDAEDSPRALALRSELEALEDQLAAALGLGGKPRRQGSNVERARVNVQRRLRDALRRIEAQEPNLSRMLERALKTGITCVYDP